MKRLEREIRRLLSLLMVAALIVVSAPQEYWTVRAAEEREAGESSETEEKTQQEGDMPEQKGVETAETKQAEQTPETGAPETEGQTASESLTAEETAPESESETRTETAEGGAATEEQTDSSQTATEEETDSSQTATEEETDPAETGTEEQTETEEQSETEEQTTAEETGKLAEDRLKLHEGFGYNSETGQFDNENVKWTIYDDNELVVEGTGEIVGPYNNPWSSYTDKIKTATVNVTGATSAHNMFKYCSKLQKVELAGFDTSYVTDMSSMFKYCYNLTNLDISHFKTANVTNMSEMFYECTSLENVDVGKFDTVKVTDMNRMFYNCPKLTALDVSRFETAAVTRLDYMFYGCSSLASLDVSGFQTENAEALEGMFGGCSNITALDVSGFDTSKVTNMYDMFLNCASLTSLDLTSFTIKDGTSVSSMLYGCNGLKTIENPAHIGSAVTIELPLPSTSDEAYRTYSWRLSSGKKTKELYRLLEEPLTLSTDKKFGIDFRGTNFKLTEYPDAEFDEDDARTEPIVADKGAKDTYTFTVIPDEGCIIKSVTSRAGDKSKIKLTKGEAPDQYVVSPLNEEEGYTRDEIIDVTVVQAADYVMDITSHNHHSDIDNVIVVNGDKKTEGKPEFRADVSNKYETTVYVRFRNDKDSGILIPKLYNQNDGKYILREQDSSAMSDEEKEYVQNGYSVFRMGRIDTYTYIDIEGISAYRLKFTTENFPGEVHIVRCAGTDTGKAAEDSSISQPSVEYPIGEEIITESERFFIQVKWTDTPEKTNKWCKPQVAFKYDENGNEELRQPTTQAGVDGDVWEIYPNRNMEIIVRLQSHIIELANYDKSCILDLVIDNPYARYYEAEKEEINDYGYLEKVLKKYIEVSGGDSLTISFRLDSGIEPSWTVNDSLIYTKGEDGRYTIAVKDMSKLWDLEMIDLSTYDSVGRTALSDPEANCQITNIKFRIGNRLTVEPYYTGEPLEADSMTVTAYFVGNNGAKPKKMKLRKDVDFTVSYVNHINAGTAVLIITAVPDSRYFRGSYEHPFTIKKAEAPEGQYRTLQVESIDNQYTHQANLSELFQIKQADGKELKPASYRLVTPCDKGEVLVPDEEPVLDGNILTYTMRSDATKSSLLAHLTIYAVFDNYQDCELQIHIRAVKKQKLVLGGTVTVADKEYDGREIVPDASGLQILSVEGSDGAVTTELLKEIKGSLSYQYTGVEGTVYQSGLPPVDIGTYSVQVKVSDENVDYKSEYMDVGVLRITQRTVRVIADDMKLYLDDTMPTQYGYHTDGLAGGDTVSTKSFVSCGIQSTAVLAEYPVTVDAAAVKIANPAGKDVTFNYIVVGQEGKLVVREPEPGSYTVTYRLSDPLNPQKLIKRSGNEAGKMIEKPADPQADGFVFLGWYTDETGAREWNFNADIIQGDMTLYAGWSKRAAESGGMTLCVQEILAQSYTGKAIKPAVTVYAADGKTRLKLKKDYTVTYKNNINADVRREETPQGGIGESLSDTSQGFDSALPYVIIQGKGNYTGTVYVNFHITPVDISAAEMTSDFVLKYTDQLDEKPGKYAAAVTKFQYKKKGLTYNKDYTLTVRKADGGGDTALNAKGQIPLTSGAYEVIIAGKDNFTGEIHKTLQIADKTKLFKNAKVTCKGTVSGATKENLANGIQPENLVVKMNGTELAAGKDYTVECAGNHAIGTATVTVKPVTDSGYVGAKSVTFKIQGTAFKANAVRLTGWQDEMRYTGKALTQNGVAVQAGGRELTYGVDYTVSYKNNIKKGTASMTFTANPSSGYSGSFSKKFKILPADIQTAVNEGQIQVSGAEKTASTWKLTESVMYQKGAAKPADKISLRSVPTGALLAAGKGGDYSIAYKNNKNVSNGTAYMTLKGTGNFTGSMDIYFDITKASLAQLFGDDRVVITTASLKVNYPYSKHYEDYGDGEGEWVEDELKDPDRRFEPAVTIKDGAAALKKGVDYTVEYSENSRSELEGSDVLKAVIKGIGDYGADDEEIELSVTVNRRTLSAAKVEVSYENEFTYTGAEIMPDVTQVRYKVSNGHGREDDEDYEPPEWIDLTQGEDYRVEYTKNTAKGTGTMKIIGIGGYTGSVSKTFKIQSKTIYDKAAQPDDTDK